VVVIDPPMSLKSIPMNVSCWTMVPINGTLSMFGIQINLADHIASELRS
jgi:hypothetical protein